MPKDYSTEELVINDSFINYCLGRNAEDILFWEEMAHAWPDLAPRMEEAAEIVLGLHLMLQREVRDGGLDEASFRVERRSVVRRMLPYAAVVAGAALVAVISWMVWGKTGAFFQESDGLVANATVSKIEDSIITYTSRRGERKFIVLPDSTRIYLGAESSLRLAEGFAASNREVFLSGEALFDVPANPQLPFIVHSQGQDVNVLGTLFNVKAYPEDQTTETSLIRGKVELVLPGSSKRWPLQPNQKMIVANGKVMPGRPLALQPLSYSAKDSAVLETVWSIGRLEIVNESFGDIRRKLERWYNVDIRITDKTVEDYTFTATFTHEKIGDILKILQQTYYFSYHINGNTITITK